ncbi:MAG: TolB family protein, partial [Thermodesulfobacteriota bacterium]
MIDVVAGLFPDPVRLLAVTLRLLAGAVLVLGMLEVLLFAVASIVLSRREGRSKAPPGLAVLLSALALGVGSSRVSPPGVGAQEVPTIEARFTRLISSDSMTLLNPTLSPDRRWIAFATFAEGEADIWVVSAEGGDPIRLTNVRHLSQYPEWFPSGDRIAFLSDQVAEEPGLMLYIMSIPFDPETGRATGAARQVSLEPARDFAISPDGRWIAYGTYVMRGKLQVIPSEGGAV